MGHPRRPGPRSGPRRVGHGRRPGPRTRRPNGPRRCVWAISMPCALPDHIMRMDQWSTCRTNHAAHAKAHVRAGIADHPDGPRSIRRTNQIRGPRESPCGDGHADHPWSMDRAGRWRPCPPGHGPRTIWAGRRVDPVHAVHGPRAHRHRAGLPKRTWSGAMRIARRARDRCRIPDSRRAGSRPWTSPRSAGAGTRRGAPCPASVRQPAPNKQRHNRHIREIKPDMKTSTQTDEKARHRNQKQRRQNQEPTQPVTRYDAIRKPKKKHIPMQSPKEMDFLHPPPHGGRLSAELQRF